MDDYYLLYFTLLYIFVGDILQSNANGYATKLYFYRISFLKPNHLILKLVL